MVKHRTTIEIDKELYDWHRETFPNGTFFDTINKLLGNFKKVYSEHPPVDWYYTGAKLLKEEIESKDNPPIDEL